MNEGKELISNLSAKLPNVSDKSEGGQNQENFEPDIEKQDWFFFFTQANYKKARELLLVEIEQEQDIEKVQLLKSAAANMLSHYDFSSSVEEYEKLIDEYPTNYAMYSSYSWAYLSSNLPDEAISVLDRGISKIKNSEYLVLRKAQILEQYQRYDEALAIAHEKVELKGKNKSKYYCLIARIHKATNQENEARAAYIKGFKNDPSDLEVIHEIANYFDELNDYQMEFFFRKQAIILNDKDASDWSFFGNCYLNLGRRFNIQVQL